MSARYSNTCSRGIAIVVETVTASTRGSLCARRRTARGHPNGIGARLRDRPLIRNPDRVTELGPMHETRARGGLAPQPPAQLAQHPVGLVQVDALAHERGSVAAIAALATGRELPDAP